MSKIKIGADFLVTTEDMSVSSRDRFGFLFHQIEMAAKGGVHGIWMTEHHFSNYGYSPNPLMVMAGVAREFPHMHVGTAIVVMPLWHPVRLAEDLAILDILSDGKLIVGIGRGYQPYEFAGLGQDIAHNREQTEEATEVMLRCWAEDDLTYEGKFYSLKEPITVLPRPIQQPHPTIWCAATSPASIKYAADNGFHFMVPTSFTPDDIAHQRKFIQEALRSAGRPDEGFELSKNTMLLCSTNPEDVSEAVESSRWQQRVAKLLREGERPAGGKNTVRPISTGEPSDDVMRQRMIAGNPDECIEQIQRFEEVGLTYITGHFDYPTLSREAQNRSQELFLKEVMPAFR